MLDLWDQVVLIEFAGALQCSQFNAQKTRQQYSTKYNASAAYTNKSMLSEAPSSRLMLSDALLSLILPCNNFDARTKFDAQ